MSSTIVVTGPSLVDDAMRLLVEAGHTPVYVPPYSGGDALVQAVREASPAGIISRMGRLDAAAFDAAPGLRVASEHGVGVDNIDVEAAAFRGIPVLVASGANAVSVAEHAMAMLLAVTKRVVPLDRSFREGRWEKPGFQGRELAGSTLGLVGFGAIARQTAASPTPSTSRSRPTTLSHRRRPSPAPAWSAWRTSTPCSPPPTSSACTAP